MYCQNCGAQTADHARFCPNCGAALAGAPSRPAHASPAHAAQFDQGAQATHTAKATKVADVLEANYYQLLRIKQDASEAEVRAAIKTERTRWSNRVPKGGSIGEKARRVVERLAEAEKTLLDSTARAAYDQSLLATDEPVYTPIVAEGEKNWLDEAYRYWGERDMELVRDAVSKAVRQQPGNPDAWFVAMVVYEQLKEWDNASEAARQLLLLDPDNVAAQSARGDAYLAKEQNDRAKEQFERVLQLAERRGEADYARDACEKLVCLEADAVAKQEFGEVQKLEDAVNNSTSMHMDAKTSKQIEELHAKAQGAYANVAAVYARVENPSEYFVSVRDDHLKTLKEIVDEYEQFKGDASQLLVKPFIYCGICLGIILVARLVGGAFLGLVALLACYVTMNKVNCGDFCLNAIDALTPHTEDCLMAQVGSLRCLLALAIMTICGFLIVFSGLGAR